MPWLHVATKTLLALISVAFLGLSAVVAHAAPNGAPWRNACIFAMVVVVIVAAQARTRWSFVVLFAAVALGFTSCSNTFHWGGG
jgi:energy-coupling factor transporter transmembrane protein EcfT